MADAYLWRLSGVAHWNGRGLERGPLCECEAFMPCLPPLGLVVLAAIAKAKESGSSCMILSVMIASNSSSISGAFPGRRAGVRGRARVGGQGQGEWPGLGRQGHG